MGVKRRILVLALFLAAGSVVGVRSDNADASSPGAQAPPGSDGREPADFTGPCEVVATIIESGTRIDPAVSGGVYAVPVDGTVSYLGRLTGVDDDPGPRQLSGWAEIDLPWPLPDVRPVTWDTTGGRLDEAGTYPYSVGRPLAPIGATFRVRVRHTEPGVVCEGSVVVRLDGGFLEGSLAPLVAALTAVSMAGMVFAARPQRRADSLDPKGVQRGF